MSLLSLTCFCFKKTPTKQKTKPHKPTTKKTPNQNPKANIKQQDPRESRKNEINNRGNWLAPPTKCCLTEKLNSVGLNKALNWLGQKKKKNQTNQQPSSLRYKSNGFTDFKCPAGLEKLFTKAVIANACKLLRAQRLHT